MSDGRVVFYVKDGEHVTSAFYVMVIAYSKALQFKQADIEYPSASSLRASNENGFEEVMSIHPEPIGDPPHVSRS